MMIAGSQAVALAGSLHAGLYMMNTPVVSAAITTNVFPAAFGFRPWRIQGGIRVNPAHFRREWNSVTPGIPMPFAERPRLYPTVISQAVAHAATR